MLIFPLHMLLTKKLIKVSELTWVMKERGWSNSYIVRDVVPMSTVTDLDLESESLSVTFILLKACDQKFLT